MGLAFHFGKHIGICSRRLACLLAGMAICWFFVSAAAGLVIYQLGGATVRPPVELGGEGV